MSDSPAVHVFELRELYLSDAFRPTFREQLAALVEAAATARTLRDRALAMQTLYAMADAADAYTRREA